MMRSLAIAVVWALLLSSQGAEARKGDTSISVLTGEALGPSVLRMTVGRNNSWDFGVDLSSGPLFFGSRGWKDNVYAGAGFVFPADIGLYGLIGAEAQWIGLTVMAECSAYATTGSEVSAFFRLGGGYSW